MDNSVASRIPAAKSIFLLKNLSALTRADALRPCEMGPVPFLTLARGFACLQNMSQVFSAEKSSDQSVPDQYTFWLSQTRAQEGLEELQVFAPQPRLVSLRPCGLGPIPNLTPHCTK